MLGLYLATSVPAFAVSGKLKSSTDFFQQSLGPPTEDLIPYLEGEIGDKHKFTKWFRLQWRLSVFSNLVADPDENEKGIQRAYSENLFVDAPEGFLELRRSSMKLRVGMDTVNWGVVDLASPSNVVNTSTYFHPLRLPKRAAPMAEWLWDSKHFGLHAVYIPRQVQPILPATDSRWLPRDVLVTATADNPPPFLLPDPIEYSYGDTTELNHARDHNAGARLKAHFGSLDMYLLHFEGMANAPRMKATIVVDSLPTGEFQVRSPVVLRPYYYRSRTSGLGAVWARESWIFRLESVYSHTISEDPDLIPWSWTNVGGLETGVDIGSSTLTLLAQYYHRETPQKADNYISSSYRIFDRTGLLGLRWPVTDEWHLTGSAVIETYTNGLFWLASLENKWTDTLRWSVGWRDFSANERGLIKTFDKNDHANLELTYYF